MLQVNESNRVLNYNTALSLLNSNNVDVEKLLVENKSLNLYLLLLEPEAECYFEAKDPLNFCLSLPGLVLFSVCVNQSSYPSDNPFLCNTKYIVLFEPVNSNDPGGELCDYQGQYELFSFKDKIGITH